jgi:chemotaxis protein MotB
MKKQSHQKEPENLERWLLTYADLITLLLGLFVILYAMSKIDATRYAETISALSGVFGGNRLGSSQATSVVVDLPSALLKAERENIAEELRNVLRRSLSDSLVLLTSDERGITVHLLEELLFASGSAELKRSSLTTLDTLASVLQALPNPLRVEGHTDNVPIHTALFPSNWHLSVARAVNAAYYLMDRHGVQAERISVVGYAEYRPLVPNTTPELRSKNRRVAIVILLESAPASGAKTNPRDNSSENKGRSS